MVRRWDERTVTVRHRMYEGEGDVLVRAALSGPEEMCGKGRLLSQLTVPPGSTIGYHVHQDEAETFIVLSGEGDFDDNGTVARLTPGDVLLTGAGEGHSVRNTGSEPLVILAIILYK